MTDNVQISDNPVVAADVIGGVAFQRVKVVWGANDSVNDTSAASPLPVTAASLPLPSGASTAANQGVASAYLNNLVNALVGVDTGGAYNGLAVVIIDAAGSPLTFSQPTVISVTTTDLDTTALGIGDVMTDSLLEFQNAVALSGGTGHILRAKLTDAADVGAAVDAYLLTGTVSESAKNALHSLSDSDGLKVIDKITFDTYEDHTLNQTSTVRPSPPIAFNCTGTSLYVLLVSRGTPTYSAANALTLTLQIQSD